MQIIIKQTRQDYNLFNIKSFEEFLKLMEQGKIRITFKIDIFWEGARQGEIHDRGTRFKIQEIEMQKLFSKIKI